MHKFLVNRIQHIIIFIWFCNEANFSELKNHAYFDGIDWQKVTERKNDAPFEPTDLKINVKKPLDPVTLFGIDFDDQPIEAFVNKFSRKLNEYSII